MTEYDVAVIGGGPAGISAALGALSAGARRVLLIERDDRLGGIPNQCAHRGFGLKYFGEELTGSEYAGRLRKLVGMSVAEVRTGTAVLKITKDRRILLSGKSLSEITAGAVVLASGCRERPIGTLAVTGARPSGVFTAGAAQRMINLGGYDIGHKAVVLGSGDVGMIVSREIKKRGGNVAAVIESRDVCGGLLRNRIDCLEAFNIPLIFCSTVTEIRSAGRITGVTVKNLVTGALNAIECDTLIVSVGLIPETELLDNDRAQMGKVFDFLSVCGNACYVHDTADDVTEESERAGKRAADFAAGRISAAGGPQRSGENKKNADSSVCLACPKQCVITEDAGGYDGMACGRPDPVFAGAPPVREPSGYSRGL